MRYLRIAGLALGFVVLMSIANATEILQKPPPPSINWSWSTETLNRYVAAPIGTVAYDHAVVQSSLTASFQNGCYATLWASKSLDGRSAAFNFGNEIDYTFGCTGSWNGFGWEVQANYYDLSNPHLFQATGDLVVFAGEINHPLQFGAHTITPYLRVEPAFPVGISATSGVWWYAGLRHSWKINDLVTFTQAGRLAYDTGVFDTESGLNARYDAAIVWHVTAHIDLRAPIFRAWFPLSTFSDGRTDELVFGAGFDVHH